MMIMIMMAMIIKIIIGGHRGLIFMHLLKVYARRDIHNWKKEKRII